MMMAFGYRYTLERQENGWWLVRFPGIPGGADRGRDERGSSGKCSRQRHCGSRRIHEGRGSRCRERARDTPDLSGRYCRRSSPQSSPFTRRCGPGWSRVRLAEELGMSENSVRRLSMHHSSHMWIIDDALAKMNASYPSTCPRRARVTGGMKSTPVARFRALVRTVTRRHSDATAYHALIFVR